MKFHCTTLLAFLFITISTNAQDTWPAEDAEWYMGHECPSQYDVDHHWVNGMVDSLGEIYTRINSKRVGLIEFPDTTILLTEEFENFVRFNGDTLFWLFEGIERPLLCFNLEVGDTWDPIPLELPNPDSECTPSSMMVLEKTTVEYNGETYRQMIIGPEIPYPAETDDPEPHVAWYGVFDERTFGREQLFPHYNICGGVVDWYCFNFRCYSDGALSIQESTEECDHPLSVSIPEIYDASNTVKIYPNPITTGQQIFIDEIDSYQALRIYAADGKMILQLNSADLKHQEIRAPSPGNYIVQTKGKDGAVGYSKLIVTH